MIKGITSAAICIGALVAFDYEFYGSQYTDKTLFVLRQIGYFLGF